MTIQTTTFARFGSDDHGGKSHFYVRASRVGKSIFVREIAFQTALRPNKRARFLTHARTRRYCESLVGENIAKGGCQSICCPFRVEIWMR